MRWMRADEERGWILLETAVLGLLVLATAAALSIFARTAFLADLASARTEAALAARAQFSLMEAELDQGILPLSEAAEIQSHEPAITSRRSSRVQRSSTMYLCAFRGRLWGARSRQSLCGG